jgi:hypothetical protein
LDDAYDARLLYYKHGMLHYFFRTKISMETLANMLSTQSGSFQNFEFESLAGISSNTWQMKIEHLEFTVKITIAVRPATVAMLLDSATVEPSPLCPDSSREKGRRRGVSTQDPPSLLPQLAAHRRPS